MANQAAFNPIFVDTPPFVWQPDAKGNPTRIPLKIKTMVWSGYSADTDTVTVTDAYGNVIWEGFGYAQNFQQESPNIGWVQGLQVPTLTAGKLQIYLDFKA